MTMEVTKKNRQDMISSSEAKFYEAWEEDKRKLKAERAKYLREHSNLGLRFSKRTFETFDASSDKGAYEKCLHYAESYAETERNSIIISGSFGTGKTHLAASIANRLLDNGVPVLFDTFSGHLAKLRSEFNGDKKTYLGQMQNVDMLVLDDVGKEKQTEWTLSIMFDVINYRYEHLLPVVITTNLDSASLATYMGGAVWSRLCEMCIGARTAGEDYRLKGTHND